MKKVLCLILAIFLYVPTALAMTFVDANGRSVEVADHPQRVISLYNSYGDAWVTAGGTLVGSIADAFDGDVLGENVQNLGSHTEPNMELLFSLDPDFVLLSADVASHVDIADMLEEAGIPCAFFSTQDWRDYMESIRIFTQLTGREDLYQQQLEIVQQPIEEILAETQTLDRHPTALLIRANSITVKARSSEGTVAGAILHDMGFVNLADSNSALCESISMETILVEDPDYIFVVLQGSNADAANESLAVVLTDNPAWNTLSAVQDGHFYVLDRDLFHYHPNARWAESYSFMLKVLKESSR